MQISTEAIKKVKHLGLIKLIRAQMKYFLFNVSKLNKVLISRWWITRAVLNCHKVHLSLIWAINNVQCGYDIHQAGDQSVIHSNPLRTTKRHGAEIVCWAVNLSTSLLEYTVQHSDYCVNDEEHNRKVEFGSRTRLAPLDLLFLALWLEENAAGHYCNWTKWGPHPKTTSLGLEKRIADHKQEMIPRIASECCLATLDTLIVFSLLSLKHRRTPESQTSIGRLCHVAEWLTEFNEGVCQNKGLFFWCLVVLSSDSYIKAALVCGDSRFVFVIWSEVIHLCMKSIHQDN